jgi:hypothetical protein
MNPLAGIRMLWDPELDKGLPRLLFIARPGPGVSERVHALLIEHGIEARAEGSLFERANWHQSVSDRYNDFPAVR